MAARQEFDTLPLQQLPLPGEVRRKPPGVVDDAVAGIIAVIVGDAQHAADKAGIALTPDEARELPVGGHAAVRDLLDDGEDLVDQLLGQNLFHSRVSVPLSERMPGKLSI